MIGFHADALPGCRLVRGSGATPITTVEIDSRRVTPGALFCAIRGGHAFTDAARAAGAAAVLVNEEAAASVDGVVLAAPDTITALQSIAAANRRRAGACMVVAVTGSTGKTSTKDILAGICGRQRRLVAARAGYNTEIGVPHTLCSIEADTRVAVCEMAMRAETQIRFLCALASPRIGVITNIGEAHIELLGSRERIAAAKSELISALPSGGVAVIPADEPLLGPYLRDDLNLVRFGTGGADVAVRDREPRPDGMRLTLDIRGRRIKLRTNLCGAHHAQNLAAAFAVALALDLDLDTCAADAASITLQPWRGERHALPGGGVLVNDAYNANPASMQAALETLAEQGSGRLIAVLGEMAELGRHAGAAHSRIGDVASRCGYQVLVAVGAGARGYLDPARTGIEQHYIDADADVAAELVRRLLQPGDRVLVKASRVAGLEGVAHRLAAGEVRS